MSQCEKTEKQAEQNKSHAVAGIEAHPTPPHCCFVRNDGCNLAHTDLQCGVAGRELWPPERVDEVDDSERKHNTRTKNHENFCGQDALPILVDALLIPLSFATISLLARDAPQILCRIILLTKYKPGTRPGALRSPFLWMLGDKSS